MYLLRVREIPASRCPNRTNTTILAHQGRRGGVHPITPWPHRGHSLPLTATTVDAPLNSHHNRAVGLVVVKRFGVPEG